MTKKISAEQHTGPFFLLVFAVAFLGVALWISWPATLFFFAIIAGTSLLFSTPYLVAYLWNKFVADEDEYYD